MNLSTFKVIIVGGGVSGLGAADRFQEASHQGSPISFTLLEGSPQFGGKILTQQMGGFLIEGGPESFVSYKPWALEVCERLGLGSQLIETNREQQRVYTLREGQLLELPQGLLVPSRLFPYLTSSVLSVWGKVRMLGDLVLPKFSGTEDESVAAFVKRRLGREALIRLVEPLLSGIYAGDVERMSLKSAFPLFYDLEQEYGSLIRGLLQRRKSMSAQQNKEGIKWTTFVTLREGTGQLVDAWVKHLSPFSLVSGKKVEKVQPKGPLSYRVLIEGGEVMEANAVVLTVPSFEAARLVEGFAPVLSSILKKIPFASTATVSLGFRQEEISHPLDGYGFIVPRIEGRRILAATWTSTKFPHRAPPGHALIRCFLGGTLGQEVLSLGDQEMVRVVREELRGIMGISVEPVFSKVFRWDNATPQYTVGHQNRLDSIEKALREFPGLVLTGSSYRGIGIPDCIHQGTLAAERILKDFSRESSIFPEV